jgi:DDE_Tnp_1-associated/Transposase DDE domain
VLTAPRRDLRDYLAQVPDPRGCKGRRHVFKAILTAVVCATLQNCRGYDAIGQWLHEQSVDFLHLLGFRRKPPTASGLRKVLSRIDVEAFERALTNWIGDILEGEPSQDELLPLALDGKSLRGTWDRFQGAVHLLAVIDQRTRCVLHQRTVPGDTNERMVALEVLKELVLTGRVVTADAAFCYQDVCQTITDSGGHYVLPVKDNQPQLLAAITSEFAAKDAAFSPLRTADS